MYTQMGEFYMIKDNIGREFDDERDVKHTINETFKCRKHKTNPKDSFVQHGTNWLFHKSR